MSETITAGSAAFDAFRKRERSGVLLRASISFWVAQFALALIALLIMLPAFSNFASAIGSIAAQSPAGYERSAPPIDGGGGALPGGEAGGGDKGAAPGTPELSPEPAPAPEEPPVQGGDKPAEGGVAPMSFVRPIAQDGSASPLGAQQGGGASYAAPAGPGPEAVGVILQAYMALAPGLLLLALGGAVLRAAFEAASLRWLIHGEVVGGPIGISFGGDTWRVLLCYIMWVPIFIGLYLATVIPMAIVAAVAVAGAAQGGAGGMIAGIVIPIAAIAAFCVWVFVGVRLAPASAMTVAARRFAFFDAWRATKGRFWALFFAFALLGVIFWVVIMVFGTALTFATMGSIAGLAAQGGQPARDQVMQVLFTPVNIAVYAVGYLLLMAAATALYIAYFGVNAVVARAALATGLITPEPGAAPPLTPPPSVGGPPIVEPG